MFRVASPRARRRDKLDIFCPITSEIRLHVRGPDILTGIDLAILQGLVALAGAHGKGCPPPATAVASRDKATTWLEETEWLMHHSEKLRLHLSYRTLAWEVGLNPDANHRYAEHISKSLRRLFETTVYIECGERKLGTRIISALGLDEAGTRKEALVVVNGILTQTILGQPVGPQKGFANLPMAEVRHLSSLPHPDATRILHAALAACVFPGKQTQRITLKAMAQMIFPRLEEADPRVQRRYRANTLEALERLQEVGWKVTEVKKAVFDVSRPAA